MFSKGFSTPETARHSKLRKWRRHHYRENNGKTGIQILAAVDRVEVERLASPAHAREPLRGGCYAIKVSRKSRTQLGENHIVAIAAMACNLERRAANLKR